MSDTKHCLVLGANGFVGSYIVERLAAQTDVTVRAFDRFSRDPQFIKGDSIEVFKGDFFSDDDIKRALEGVDMVLHSFSATNPFVSDKNPYLDITNNLLRSVQIFDMCIQAGVKKIGFISSGGAVYGSVGEEKIMSEEDSPLPVSPYGINKLAIEYYLEFFKRKYGTKYVVYRLSNPYGPRQLLKNNQGVIPAFLGKIRNHEPLTVYGDGTSSRDYIFAPDAANMIATSFMRDNVYSVYNIGRGEQTSLNEIIDTLRELSHAEVTVNYEETPRTFLQRTGVSIGRYESEYGKQSFTSLQEGIKKTIEG